MLRYNPIILENNEIDFEVSNDGEWVPYARVNVLLIENELLKTRIKLLELELNKSNFLDEALNSGNGTYRP